MKNLKLRMTGLCTSCTNWENCTLLVNHTNPIHQCEEFELSRETTQPDISQIFSANSKSKDSHNQFDQGKILKGLCINCALREMCILTDKETGVWHCEEYK